MIPLLFLLLAQTPAPTPPKSSLEGTVVSATTGTPLKKVVITFEGGQKNLSAVTTVEGKFRFENLEPGNYIVKAERAGYLEMPGTAVTIPPGGLTRHLKLTPQAVISGRVLDEDGDPVLGVRVAYIRWIAAGDKKFKVEEDMQDANGEGGFTITGLPAGNYYLQAVPDRIFRGEQFSLTFYPSSLDLTGAAVITLAAGGEARNLEIRMRKSLTFRVHGKVSIPAGATGVPAALELISQDSAETSLGGPASSASIVKGEFEFTGVQPGSYILRSAALVQTSNHETGEFSGGTARFFFRQPLEVSDHDIDDLAVTFESPVDLTGVFHADGVNLTRTPTVNLYAENFHSWRPLTGEADLNGGFHIAQLPPDRFEVTVSNLPDGAYVQSVRRGSLEVKGSLDLTSASEAPLEITLAPNAAEIAGTLRDANGDLLPHRVVNLWSSDDEPTKSQMSASDGSFRFKNLAPGDYHVAAWDTGDHEVKPNFRKLFETQSAAVSVHEGSHENADVKLIVPE